LEQRLLSHNKHGKKGWTIKYRSWELVYKEACGTNEAAILREKQLKSAQGRAFIWKLVKEKYGG
jgi:putative endonuclease